MRYSQIFETSSNVDRKRRATEVRNKKHQSANNTLKRARDEEDPSLRSAMVQSANAKKREADAKFRKSITEYEHFYEEPPSFPNPGCRSMTKDEVNAIMCRLEIIKNRIS